MKRVLGVFLCGALLSGGCSFAFVSGPPAQHERLPYFECTTSKVVPILDVLFTVLQVVNLGAAASSTDEEWDDRFGGDAPISRNASIYLYVALAGLGAGGAYYGFTKTAQCSDAKEKLFLRMSENPQPGTWPPPAPAPQPDPQPSPAPLR